MGLDTPISFSLPFIATSGETEAPFLCTVQLVNVLQTAQNEFVEVLGNVAEADQPLAPEATRLTLDPVTVSAATDPAAVAALLVSLDPERVLAHRVHCFRAQGGEVGQGFDFTGLEQSLRKSIRG